mmetsp:Transcript_71856/g.116526  ORF Transcript_71856/g.116526 Transcript_71856/m.116526 type:complete len:353 (+) Transcript_71856:2-1060(+)
MVREKKRLRAQAAKSVDRAPVPCPYASAFQTPATPRKESVGSVHFGASQNAAPQSLMDSPLANPKPIASAATNTAEDVWVNCDSCKKWRKMPLGSEIDTAKSFVCMLNNVTCETPEEVCAEEKFVYYNDTDNGGLQRRLTTTPAMGEILSITTTPTMRGTIKVQRVGGVMCTEFNPGMWHKTNSLKCLLDGFASKEIISVDTKDGCKPMPFFTVNNKAFSHIQVHDPEQFYSLLCHYVTRSCLYMNKRQFSERPDGRIFNLFNDLGFKSRAENFLPAKSIKGKKDVYWWDLETWNVGKAARSASTERTKNLQPRLVPVDTDVFPFPFYDFGHTHSLDHEQVLIDDVMSSIRI